MAKDWNPAVGSGIRIKLSYLREDLNYLQLRRGLLKDPKSHFGLAIWTEFRDVHGRDDWDFRAIPPIRENFRETNYAEVMIKAKDDVLAIIEERINLLEKDIEKWEKELEELESEYL